MVVGVVIARSIYYDGILFDRFTMVRVRKTLERYSKSLEPLIDMHTGDDYTYAGQLVTDAVAYVSYFHFLVLHFGSNSGSRELKKPCLLPPQGFDTIASIYL